MYELATSNVTAVRPTKPSVKLERQSNDYQISVEFRSLFARMTVQPVSEKRKKGVLLRKFFLSFEVSI